MIVIDPRTPLTEEELEREAEWERMVAKRTDEQKASDAVKAAERISMARKEFLFHDPFMGYILCKFQFVHDDSIRTMGVSLRECNVLCWYNAAWVIKLDIRELMGVMEHEALHILDHHMSRRASRDPHLWNVAADMAINCLIKLPLPRPGCFVPLDKPEWLNKSSEYIYDDLPRGPEFILPQPFDDHDVWKAADHAGIVDIVTRQLVQEAVARTRGTVPGQYQALVDKILKTKCDWRTLLKFYVTSKIRAFRKLSYKRRDKRRVIISKFAFPGYVRREGIEVIVVCDTSGSMMNKRDMEQFFAELEAIIRQTSARTRLIQIDSSVMGDQIYKTGDWKNIKVNGGGGTDFRPVFDYIKEKEYKPSVIVFYTDGYGTFPDTKDAPGYKVIWAMITDVVAPFGKTMKLDLD